MAIGVVRQEDMFTTALPYGLATLGIGVVGAITAVAATATIGIIMGIALGILGAYSFLGVISCGVTSVDATEFRQNIWKHMATAAGTGISEIVVMVVKAVILEMIFGRKRA
ncbi:MAG: hypothetical protein JSS30_00645 [Verrucomicrobia bacterium]|nr:hypothetical protein [Verrucomicrobiota bacterium]